jgi:putative transposase
MGAAAELAADIGAMAACDAFGVARASFYRHHRHCDGTDKRFPSKRRSPLALSVEEKQRVMDLMHSEAFVDMAPHQIYARLLDQGDYLCSVRTMYRLLKAQHGQVNERRRHVQRPAYAKPELLATAPNQVWSWDITKLKNTIKWTYFYLYVIIDIFSRYVVGWMVAYNEQAALAKRLISHSLNSQNIGANQLTLHADRGSSMKSKAVAELLVDLGVIKSHSRPHVSDDNPFSEAQFKTLKYCPQFPERFGSIEDARAFCQTFFTWYNHEHRHTGIGLMTPAQVQYGLADQIYQQRCRVLTSAYQMHPQRFKHRQPTPPHLSDAVWINKPKLEKSEESELNFSEPVSHFH